MDRITARKSKRMRRISPRPLFLLVVLAAVVCPEFARAVYPEAGNTHMSDREKAGLRGRVESCTELSSFAGGVTGDGTQIPAQKSSFTTKYDVDGNILVTHGSSTNGPDWSTRNTYDAAGHLLKSDWGSNGESSRQVTYAYDDQGRLLKTTDSTRPDNPLTFHYDEHGRKTAVQISRPADYRPQTATGGSPFEAASGPPNLPGGGTATTIYDELDRPTEVQVRDAQGLLVMRAVRTYDKNGRIAEEHQILDNPQAMFPPEFEAEMLKAGASPQDLRDQLAELMGGQAGLHSISYSYDGQGRVIQKRERFFNQEEVTETTYNEHGDKAAEITRSKPITGDQEQSAPFPPYHEVRYSYQYDDHGNWTEETMSYRSAPDSAFESSPGRQRTLTYY